MQNNFLNRMRQCVYLGLLPVLFFGTTPANAQQTAGGDAIGLGLAVMPRYDGAKDYHVVPFPNATLSRGEFFIDGLEAGMRIPLGENWVVGPLIGANLGRKEDDADRLNGLGNIAVNAQLGAFAHWHDGPLGAGLTFRQSAHAGYGNSVSADVSSIVFARGSDHVRVAASTTWRNGPAMQTYFGIDDAQAQSSTAHLPAYHASAGFSEVALQAQWQHQFDRHWALKGSLGVGALLGDAADSPIVERKASPFGTLGVSYQFDR
jgi:outer membrane scaffolding protein for murein synthesis (MipA/OmpV family)